MEWVGSAKAGSKHHSGEREREGMGGAGPSAAVVSAVAVVLAVAVVAETVPVRMARTE